MLAQAAVRGAAKHGHSVVKVLKVFCRDLPDGPLIDIAMATVANEAIASVSKLPHKYVVTCFIAIWWGAANYAPCRAMPTPCHAIRKQYCTRCCRRDDFAAPAKRCPLSHFAWTGGNSIAKFAIFCRPITFAPST